MKLKLLITLVFALTGVIWVSAQGTVAQVALTTPISEVNAGDTFTLTIEIAEAVGVYGGSVRLTYDPLLLAVIAPENQPVTPGDFFAAGPSLPMKNTVDAASGTINYALTLRQPAEPVTGGGVLGTIQFEALADGAAQVELAEALLLSPVFQDVNGRKIASRVDELPVQTQSVMLTVGGAAAESDVPPFVAHSGSIRPAQPIVPVTIQATQTVSPALLIGGMFFALGLLMFMFSVVTYTRLRRFDPA